jgi:hypothetical protein
LAKASTLVTFACHCCRLFHLKNIANGNTALRNIFKLFVGFIQDTNTQKEKAMKTYLTIYGAMTFGQKSFE